MSFEISNQLLFQPVLADIGLTLLQLLLFFVSLWLIFLILIQRGKGGGLTAAFGGGGGDSAFGAKAGDAFTKITIFSALIWITLCMVTIAAYNPPSVGGNPFDKSQDQAADFAGSAMSAGAGDAEAGGAGAAAGDGDSSESSEGSDASSSGSDERASGDGASTESESSNADSAEGDQ